MKTAAYRLVVKEEMDLDGLRDRIAAGYTFRVFRYNVGLLFLSFTLFSPAILIAPDEKYGSHNTLYNIITALIGWISIPAGPAVAVKTILLNNDGGLDVTSHVMLNINKANWREKRVEIHITNELFIKPDRADIKELRKAIQKDFEGDSGLHLLAFGLFINTNSPHFVIGLHVDGNPNDYQEKVRKSVYRKFQKRTVFEFLFLEENPSQVGLLIDQGKVIYAKHSLNLEQLKRLAYEEGYYDVNTTVRSTVRHKPGEA